MYIAHSSSVSLWYNGVNKNQYLDSSLQTGGFFSAEDADSLPTADAKDKKEGAFCVWEEDEIRSLLVDKIEGSDSVTLADVFCKHYDVRKEGNVNFKQVCFSYVNYSKHFKGSGHYW